MTIGERLRTARAARQMSLGDIHRRTNIQPRFLEAIDADRLDLLPDSHRRLFIREYARVVGVDPEELYRQLDDYVPPAPAEPVPVATDRALPTPIDERPEAERRTSSEFLKRMSKGEGVSLGGSGATAWLIRGALVLILIVGGYFLVRGVMGDGAGSVDEIIADSTSGDEAQILPRPGEDTTAATDADSLAAGDSLTLEGHATGRVWVAMVADGSRSDQGVIDSGETRIWRAMESFKISVGNAGHLELVLNGKPLGTLGPPRTSVRNKVIDAQGIKERGPGARSSAPAAVVPPAATTRRSRQAATTTRRPPSSSTTRRTQPRTIQPAPIRPTTPPRTP